jgi:hypothetical protein
MAVWYSLCNLVYFFVLVCLVQEKSCNPDSKLEIFFYIGMYITWYSFMTGRYNDNSFGTFVWHSR